MVGMAKTSFIFVIHFHQPVGQLRHVLDRVQRNSYELLLRVFESYPGLRFTLHFSGPLIMYWREYYPEFLGRLADYVKRSGVEVLGGTFSEAALPLLPAEDRVRQLKMGRELVEEVFGVEPRGAWLPERVWDPTLPPALAEAEYEYVILDDEVGYRAGLWKGDVHRAQITEYSGVRSGVFFIDGPIRYILPWRSQEEVFDYLRGFASERGEEYVLWGSDAEKFGEWWDPGPAEAWLRRFLDMLVRAGDVELLTPSEYLRRFGYRGPVYLYPGSYDKMMEWSGGYFPNFVRKYRESNNMHKKMLYVRRKLEELKAGGDAWLEYYMAQCNDAYWHGLFGGIYLAHLRQGVYEHLVRAERLAEEQGGLEGELRVRELDFDYDGEREVLVEAGRANFYIKPGDGGSLFELDVKEPGDEFNLVNSMGRYGEPYLSGVAWYRPDWYRRVSFREHIWREGAGIWDWVNNTPFADVSDFALGRYLLEDYGDNFVRLVYTGRDWSDRSRPKRLLLVKTYRFSQDGSALEVEYRWRNMELETVRERLSVELTLTPRLSYESEDMPWYTVDGEFNRSVREHHVSPWSRSVTVHSPVFRDVHVEDEKHARLWVAPIETLSRTEKGLRKEYQALGVMFIHEVELGPGEAFSTKIRLGW